RPDLAAVLSIARETALGLAAAHDRGLVHRDIKPAHLFLESPSGRGKILDFGLARPPQGASQLTQPGLIGGTPDSMAPQQAERAPGSVRSDVFGLGRVLYRLLAGDKPFRGGTTMAVLQAVALKQPRPLKELNPSVPPALAALVTRLMAKAPADRP